eukprot:gene7392-7458_t
MCFMIFIRSLIFNIAFYVNLTVLMLVGLPRLLGGRVPAMKHARLWGASSIWLMEKICNIKVEFRGLDNLPQGACMIASKHQSVFETFALLIHCPDFTYAVKKELRKIPLFGWYLAATEQIAVDRQKGGAIMPQLLRAAGVAFEEGRQFLIFPEGTRRPAGAPPAYKFGVAQIYAGSNVTCVPVALNAGLFWPRRSFLLYPGILVVEFLEPIAPGLERRAFFELLQERIETASNRLIAEAIAQNPDLAKLLP